MQIKAAAHLKPIAGENECVLLGQGGAELKSKLSYS